MQDGFSLLIRLYTVQTHSDCFASVKKVKNRTEVSSRAKRVVPRSIIFIKLYYN